MDRLRLILDPPRPAALNMAIDEFLMHSQGFGARPTLRFYGWDKPSVSIGYFQKIGDAVRKFDAVQKDIPVVRRLSGGGTVLHGEDLTFSLSIGTVNPFFPTDVKSSYLRINEAVRTGLKELCPQLDYADCRTVPTGKRQAGERNCFEQPACYDLLLSGKKILGASQRRIGKELLHQSSLFLSEDRERLTRAIVNGFASLWKVAFDEKPLSGEELAQARELEERRYGSSDWASDLRVRSFSS